MSVPWSEKGSKVVDLAAADQFMIIDSEDTIPSTINKRVTLSNLQSNLVTDVDANGFDITSLQFLEFQAITDTVDADQYLIYLDSNELIFNAPSGDFKFIIDGDTEVTLDTGTLSLDNVDLNLREHHITTVDYIDSGAIDVATAGFLRLQEAQTLNWLDVAETADNFIGFSSDVFEITFSGAGNPHYDFGVNDFTALADGTIGSVTVTQSEHKFLKVFGSIESTDAYLYPDGTTQITSAIPNDLGGHLNTNLFVQSFDASAFPDTTSIFYDSYGTNAYVVSLTDETLTQLSLSTPYDISTGSTVHTLSTSSATTHPVAVFFSSDGLELFILGEFSTSSVSRYILSTAWTISTATLKGTVSITQDATVNGLSFRPDGRKMYVVGTVNKRIYEFDLSIPWDLDTLGGVTQSFDISTQSSFPLGIFIRNDGKILYLCDQGNNTVFEFEIIIPWDITSMVVTDFTLDVSALTSDLHGIFISPDQTNLSLTGGTDDLILQYELGISTETIIATDITASTITATDTFLFQDGSTQPLASQSSTIFGNISTFAFKNDDGGVIVTDFAIPTGFAWSRNGLILNVCGLAQPGGVSDHYSLFQYFATTAFDPSTLGAGVLTLDFESVTTNIGSVFDISWNDDGTVLFVGDIVNDTIVTFNGSVDYNTSTIDQTASATLSLPALVPSVTFQGFFIQPGGKKFWFSSTNGDIIYEIDLTSRYDFSAASAVYNNVSLSVTTFNTFPRGISFSTDGKKLYIPDTGTGDQVSQWDMIIGYDIVNAVHTTDIPASLMGDETNPSKIIILPDNSQMQIIGFTQDTLRTYDLGISTSGPIIAPVFVTDFTEVDSSVTLSTQGRILVDSTSSAITVTLPTALIDVDGSAWLIKDIADNAGETDPNRNITIATEGSQEIDKSTIDPKIVNDSGFMRFFAFGGEVFSE